MIEDNSPAGAEVFEILRASLNNQHEIGAPADTFTMPSCWQIGPTPGRSWKRRCWRRNGKRAFGKPFWRRSTKAIRRRSGGWRVSSSNTIWSDLAPWCEHSTFGWGTIGPRRCRNRKEDARAAGGILGRRGVASCRATRKDGTDAFLALWCDALDDVPATVASAGSCSLTSRSTCATPPFTIWATCRLPDAGFALAAALDDENIAVSILAVVHGYHYLASDWSQRRSRIDASQAAGADDRFERLERLLGRTTKSPKKVVSPLWPWIEFNFDRDHIGRLLVTTRGNRPMSRLVPHLTNLGPSFRQAATTAIVAAEPWDAEIRQVIVDLAGDSATLVRANRSRIAQKDFAERAGSDPT